MDAVSVPVLEKSDTVHRALARLKMLERGGVVVTDGVSYRLLHAKDLLIAREACVALLENVAGGEPVTLLSRDDADQHKVDLIRPLRTMVEYEDMLKTKGTGFALVGEDLDVAMIVTRSEKDAAALRSSGGYQCSATPKHYFPRPRVKPGDTCPDCLVPGSIIQVAP